MEITGQAKVEKAFDEFLQEQIERAKRLIYRNFAYVGFQCVNMAREKGSYLDQTGNLRSSIGFVIVEDGKVLTKGGFEVVKGGEYGAAKGDDYLRSIINLFPSGVVLIVVAGMNYASYVSAKGYDVLESAELLAERLVPEMLLKIGFKR